MRFASPSSKLLVTGILLACGCATTGDNVTPPEPAGIQLPIPADEELRRFQADLDSSAQHRIRRLPPIDGLRLEAPAQQPLTGRAELTSGRRSAIVQASHEPRLMDSATRAEVGTLTIDGRSYRLQPIESSADQGGGQAQRVALLGQPPVPPQEFLPKPAAATSFEKEPLPMNLPTALSLVGGDHPVVGFAQWRVQEAYARYDRAKVLWLPSIQAGFSFHKHDGNYQSSNGEIVDVNRNSFQYGLGAGATGAGTTPRPGVVAQFHLADAIFQPEIAEKTAWARQHAADGVYNQQLANVAQSYLELLGAAQELQIVQQTREDTAALAKLTEDFAATGQGLRADADRLQTELIMVQSRLKEREEQVEVASARLAQALSLEADRPIIPLDPTVVPLELVSAEYDKQSLISTALATRPELKEAQSLVAVACQEYQRQRYAPFVPSMLLGFSTGGFGGGLGNRLDNVDSRYDFDALMTWEVRNLGFGERAQRRETSARYQSAQYEAIRTMDQVAREISEAHTRVTHRRERIEIAQQAISSAENSYQLNLSRIRDAQGLPLEVLQSVRALEESRRNYLAAVIAFNQAQFQLQWALGWPVVSPE